MNPYDLNGPEFLGLYFLLGLVLLGGMRWWLRREVSERLPLSPDMTSDPYRIALLHGGMNEAIKVATISLIDRGLLRARYDILSATNADAVALVKRPIEKEILRTYSSPQKIQRSPNDKLFSICADYENELKKHGLLPSDSEKLQRFFAAFVVIAVLLTITMFRLANAFAHGRHNVMNLVFLTIVFCAAGVYMVSKRPTARGAALLADLRVLFERLKKRAALVRGGGETSELALLAAVFGMQSLDLTDLPDVTRLYSQKRAIVVEVQGDVEAVTVEAVSAVAVAAEGVVDNGPNRVGIGWRDSLAAGIVANRDCIDIVEIIAEDYYGASKAKLSALNRLAGYFPITVHGVAMGLAPTIPVLPDRVQKMARLVASLRPESWSEHLALMRAKGVKIGHLAAPPRTPASVQGAIININRAQQIVGCAPMLENIATLIAHRQAQWTKHIGYATSSVRPMPACCWICTICMPMPVTSTSIQPR